MPAFPKIGPNRGNAGKGRPKGSRNKTTVLLKDAILIAAEQHGLDGEGTDGLIGYCRLLARDQPKAFAQLLSRVIPAQLGGAQEQPVIVEIVQFSDVIEIDTHSGRQGYADATAIDCWPQGRNAQLSNH